MPETMLAMMNIMELNAQERKEAREDAAAREDAMYELYERLMKNQAAQSFAQFSREVEKSDILSDAFNSGDFTKVDRLLELYEHISKAF